MEMVAPMGSEIVELGPLNRPSIKLMNMSILKT